MRTQLRDRDHLAARNIPAPPPRTRTDKAADATPVHLLHRAACTADPLRVWSEGRPNVAR